MIASTCAFVLLLALAPAQDFATAEGTYRDAVSDRIAGNTFTPADVDAARTAVRGLVATGDSRAFDMLSADAKESSARLFDLLKERDEQRLEADEKKERVQDATGSQRSDLEADIKRAEERMAEIVGLLPSIQAIRDMVYEGLLDATTRAAAQDPESSWDVLVRGFVEDAKRFYLLDQKVRQTAAELESVRHRLLAEQDEDAKAKLERRAIELAAALEVNGVQRDRTGALKDRRVVALADLYARLPRGRQGRELNDIRGNLRDDVPWEKRSIHAELLGHLPIDSALNDLLVTLRQAAKTRRDVEKDLEPLREQYDRALKALLTASIGGGGVVPATTLANKEQREADLKQASERAYGETRVAESAVLGLGHAVARLTGEARKAGLDELLKVVRRDPDPDVRARVVDAFGKVDDDQARSALRELALGDSDLRLRLAALDALAELQDEQTVELAVTRLLRDPEWRVRAATIRFLKQVPRKSAIPALIESVGAEVGRLVDDAEQTLASLTGRSFNADQALWKDWWQKNKDTFEIGQAGAEVAAAGGAQGKEIPGHVSFYGITTRSNRILFVLDRSGSMLEPVQKTTTGAGAEKKIDAAKAQLKVALAGLEEGDHFNIVTYSTDVSAWQRKMVKMSKRVQQTVERFVDKEIEAVGGTNIHDALREAFRVAGIGAMDKAYDSNVDTIFFLTDGQPTVGEVQDPEEILRRVKEWNRLARIVVHTVGVGIDHDASFLRRLAEENGGQYTSR